jgi:hypothetical protein
MSIHILVQKHRGVGSYKRKFGESLRTILGPTCLLSGFLAHTLALPLQPRYPALENFPSSLEYSASSLENSVQYPDPSLPKLALLAKRRRLRQATRRFQGALSCVS